MRPLTTRAGVFCYDYVLTFGQEVELIWSRKISGAAILFVLNRYVTLIWVIANCIPTDPPSPLPCEVSGF